MAMIYCTFLGISEALPAAAGPMLTKSSKLAEVGMESTEAGCARALFSEAREAAVN